MSAWFHEFRYAWIKESIEIFGAINRRHVEAKFGITPAQVAIDFAEVQRRWPNLMIYNPSAKRYERGAP